VDFAAPRGTPVPAGGSGTITFRGWREGYGNYVKIRHNAAYSTAYGHLNAFARGQKLGSRVQQGQTIGYVGSTGLSTGPHLHYEIIKDGVHVNPLSVRLPGMLRLSDADKAKFAKARDRIKIQYAVLDKGFPSLAAGVLGADSLPHN
jgi:murein DD-endopeptidase MepM/ murein hydrolase activator NlpD